MSDNDFKMGFFVGILFGVISFVAVSFGHRTDSSKYNKAIEECEKSLPRDKHCKVIGVVDDGR